MSFSLSNRALLRGMLAGAVVLAGAACSRSAPASDEAAAGYRAMERDTTNNASQLDSTTTYEAADETADEQVVRP